MNAESKSVVVGFSPRLQTGVFRIRTRVNRIAINTERRNFMEYTSIPDVTVQASRVGLGTWAMGGVQWGGTDDDESVRTIHAALDLGITLIDTAPAYCPS
jgi:hypothetical protein